MYKVYHRIERIAGSVITVQADNVANQELAQVTSAQGTSLARVIRIDKDMVDLQVFAAVFRPIPRCVSSASRWKSRLAKLFSVASFRARAFQGTMAPRLKKIRWQSAARL